MKLLMEQWRQYLLEEEYEIHMMYDPASSDKKEAKTEADHNELAAKGYVHVDPEDIRKALRDEGGAAGLKAIVDRVEAEEEEVIKAMEAMKDVAQHEDGDYILDDDKKVQISETDLQEKKKKKKKKKKKGNKICKAGKEWAKRRFETYPSVYANLAASKYCKDPNYAKKDKQNEELELDEGELKKWLKQKWVRISSAGNIAGECGTSKSTKNPDRCLPAAKARSMTKAQRAATARKKKDAQKSGKDSGKTSNVANTKKGKVTKSYTSEGLQYHLDNKIGIEENVFRPGSEQYFNLFCEVRELHKAGKYKLNEAEEFFINELEIGEYALYEGELVPLDYPILEENNLNEAKYKGREVKLGAPGAQRTEDGRARVYVRDPKTGKVRVINFGSSMPDAMGDSESHRKRRKNYGDRHNCAKKKDKTAPGYWSCRATKMFGRNIPGWW